MDKPELLPLQIVPNSVAAMVIIRGLGSEHKKGREHHHTWIRELRSAKFKGSIYQYWWDSSPNTHTYFKVKSRAKEVGHFYMADDLFSCPEQSINIVAHSMGCRIPYNMLKDWKKTGQTHSIQSRLKSCIFLGGHIKRDASRPWHLFPKYFSRGLYNFYNPKDETLKMFHKTMGVFDSSPCGRKPIELKDPKIINRKVSSIGSSHKGDDYISVLSRYVSFNH